MKKSSSITHTKYKGQAVPQESLFIIFNIKGYSIVYSCILKLKKSSQDFVGMKSKQ